MHYNKAPSNGVRG